jgi:hypothetical protein
VLHWMWWTIVGPLLVAGMYVVGNLAPAKLVYPHAMRTCMPVELNTHAFCRMYLLLQGLHLHLVLQRMRLRNL